MKITETKDKIQKKTSNTTQQYPRQRPVDDYRRILIWFLIVLAFYNTFIACNLAHFDFKRVCLNNNTLETRKYQHRTKYWAIGFRSIFL